MEKKNEIIIQTQAKELEENQFIQFAIKSYSNYYTYGIETPKKEENKSIYYNWKFPFIHKKIETIESKTNLDHILSQAKEYLKNVFGKDKDEEKQLNFFGIWNYCQFVRWAEKTCFYHNDLTRAIIVDSPIYTETDENGTQKRILIIQNQDTIIKLELQLIKNSGSILDLNSIDNIYKKIIILDIKRSYGKLMNNKLIVVNGETAIRDNSDKYLILTVKQIIIKMIKDHFIELLKFIGTGEFLKDFEI